MELRPLLTLLQSKNGFTTKDVGTPSDRQIRLLGRLPMARMGDWLVTMAHVHAHQQRNGRWTVDFSKAYFPRGGKIVYAWRIILQSTDASIMVHFQDILNAFQGAPSSTRGEVMEMPLMGALRNDTNAGGKGASTIGGKADFVPKAALGRMR
jgi:hypothetical protein